MLNNLRAILERRRRAQAKRSMKPRSSRRASFRQLPLWRQVQTTDQAKGFARLGGVEPPTYETTNSHSPI
jgi:hypothetical protein